MGEGYRLVFNTGAAAAPDGLPRPHAPARRPRHDAGHRDEPAASSSERRPRGARLDAGARPDRLRHHGRSDSEGAKRSATADQASPSAEHSSHAQAAPVRHQPLRKGERRVTVRMPEDYTASAPTGSGTDDYRCFLLDPRMTSDQLSPASTCCRATRRSSTT